MKRKLISFTLCAAIALGITVGGSPMTSLTAYAATTSVTDNRAPVITVGSNSFLVEKGASFDLAARLGLTVQDDNDGNITSQVSIPKISTEQVGQQEIDLSVTDSGGLKTSQRIKINVIEVEQTTKVDRFSAVANITPSSLVNGNKTNLTVTLGTRYEDKSCFQITISDGSNTISKLITATDYQGVPFANDESKVWYQGQWIPADQWANREAYVIAHPNTGTASTSDPTGTAPGDGESYITGTDGPGGSTSSQGTAPGDATTTYDESGNIVTLDENGNPVADSKATTSGLPKTEDVVKASVGIAGILAIAGGAYFAIRKRKTKKA